MCTHPHTHRVSRQYAKEEALLGTLQVMLTAVAIATTFSLVTAVRLYLDSIVAQVAVFAVAAVLVAVYCRLKFDTRFRFDRASPSGRRLNYILEVMLMTIVAATTFLLVTAVHLYLDPIVAQVAVLAAVFVLADVYCRLEFGTRFCFDQTSPGGRLLNYLLPGRTAEQYHASQTAVALYYYVTATSWLLIVAGRYMPDLKFKCPM